MIISNYKRLEKLIINLVTNPALIPLYIKHNILQKKLPIDIELPWWSYKAIRYVDSIVRDKTVFEYGTGGSTILFSRKAKKIVAVEDDKDWFHIVEDRLNKLNITNVEIFLSPFDFRKPENFLESAYLHSVDVDNFDIIIIDGQDWSFQERIKCFRYVEPKMKEGQCIVVDDFWRYEELHHNNKAKSVKVFESVGPCRFGVTSTAVFTY